MARKVALSQKNVFSMAEAVLEEKVLFEKLRAGAVFIYPTDTIYGVGCDAQISKAVLRIRELKERDGKPFSIIAPSKEWILRNCVVDDKTVLNLLPGPYTLIFQLRDLNAVANEVTGIGTVGVRIPNHPIAQFVAKYGCPVVTTSVNKSGMPPASRKSDLDGFPVDFIIFEGDKVGVPSTIVDVVRKVSIVRSVKRE